MILNVDTVLDSTTQNPRSVLAGSEDCEEETKGDVHMADSGWTVVQSKRERTQKQLTQGGVTQDVTEKVKWHNDVK